MVVIVSVVVFPDSSVPYPMLIVPNEHVLSLPLIDKVELPIFEMPIFHSPSPETAPVIANEHDDTSIVPLLTTSPSVISVSPVANPIVSVVPSLTCIGTDMLDVIVQSVSMEIYPVLFSLVSVQVPELIVGVLVVEIPVDINPST